MNKSVSIASVVACVAIILSSNAGATPPKAPLAASAASAPLKYHDADTTRSKLRAAKGRGELMSACQKKAAEANLQDIERKDFLTACMAGK